MKSAAFCLLAISAPACNWVFGIDKTLQADDAPPVRPTARLTWLVAATDVLGNPIALPEQRPISPAPVVQIGRLGEPLLDAEIDDTGTITLPEGYDASPWRLVYRREDGLPREIQWTNTGGRIPHAVIPVFGRLDRSPIPGPNTVMTMTPSNSMPPDHVGPIVYTTGVWTRSMPTFGFPGGPTFNHDFNRSVQLTTLPGAPDHTKGDLVVLADYTTVDTCSVSTGSAAFRLALTNGPSTTISAGAWMNSARTLTVTAPADDVVRVGLAAGATGNSVTTIVQGGPAASVTMPAFTQEPGPERVPSLSLDGPLMFPMVDCTGSALGLLPTYNFPDSLRGFPQLAHIQITASRSVSAGPTLTYGLVAVREIVAGRADFRIDVAMPLLPFTLDTLDVSTMDRVPLSAGSGPVVLRFKTEAMGTSDYYEAVLHRVEGGSTAVERVYTMQQPTATIDRSVFSAGTEYIFELRAYSGAPDARAGDFTRYLPTQASAVVWTRTFVAQ